MGRMIRRTLVLVAFSGGWLPAMTGSAHFAWLATDSQGRAVYFFGESVADQTYRLPEKLASAKVFRHDGKQSMPLDLSPVDSISFIGRRSEDGIPRPAALTSQQTYGLYHGSRLTYHAQHVMGSPSEWEREPLLNVGFQAILRMKGDVLVARLLFNGKPLNGAKVQAFGEDGHENAAAMTNDRGEVAFRAAQIKPGLNGLLIEYLDKDSQGELHGERYIGDAHYLTVTFRR